VRLVMARLRLCGVNAAGQLKEIFCIHAGAYPAGGVSQAPLYSLYQKCGRAYSTPSSYICTTVRKHLIPNKKLFSSISFLKEFII
jgi:hypothetical protein